jgi:hypothetical protein
LQGVLQAIERVEDTKRQGSADQVEALTQNWKAAYESFSAAVKDTSAARDVLSRAIRDDLKKESDGTALGPR